MLTENVKNLFKFIDFLHSKTDYLLSKQNLIDDTNLLLQKRNSIRPNENYKSKIEYDKVQKQIAEKFDVVETEIIFPLKEKISELNIADVSTPIINLNAQSDLFELQRNFEEDDLKLIFEARQKYLNFRNETNCDYYLQIFFFELDRALKEFYEFFKDEDFNEFNKLQTNVVRAESLDEQGIEKTVRKIISNSNELHFETFPEFLNYFKTNFDDVEIDERHSEAKRLLEQRKLKLENSTVQSEIDEVKELSVKALKDFKHKLILSFTNENYKTKYNVGLNPVIATSKLYFEYEKLYNDAISKTIHSKLLSPQKDAKQQNEKTGTNILEYEIYELLEILIKKDNLLKTDYLLLIEKYNISTNEKLKTFYYDYLSFATRKINLAIYEFFKKEEGQDYILNKLLKNAIEKFKSNIFIINEKNYLDLTDEIFILKHENIFKKANQTFLNHVRILATDNNIFYDWEIYKEIDFWEKFYKGDYFGWLNFTEINSSVRTISFLSKEITKSTIIGNDLPTQQLKDKKNNIKPTTAISLQAKETFFSILKDFFDTEQQEEFKEVLTTFGTAKNKLIFKNNSNKFTDTFKKLFENHFIIGCQKTDLIDWIVLNFNFMYRNKVKEFKAKTVEQIISGNQTFCKKPIIEIKNGQILKIDY